jgi:hypothetical protein
MSIVSSETLERFEADVRARITAFSPWIVGMTDSRKFARLVPMGM